MNKPKNICEICKIPVASNFMHKHLASERHLRAKAAKLFYSSKSKRNPNKTLNNEAPLPENSHTTHDRVKGIWTVLKDPQSGRVLYKNKLNGKTQANKPIGLREEDIEEETFQSFVVEDYEKVHTGAGEEFEIPVIGEWRDVKADSSLYWFGGEGEGIEEENFEEEKNESEVDDEWEEDKSEERRLNSGVRKRKMHPMIQDFNEQACNEESVISVTEMLKKQLESKDTETEIIEKPEFRKQATASHFQKRTCKGKSLIKNK